MSLTRSAPDRKKGASRCPIGEEGDCVLGDVQRETANEAAFFWPIDVLRFVFALLVACGHAYGTLRHERPDLHNGFFDRVETGGLWVAGFFVLSGFCIVAGSGNPESFHFRRYMAARLTRILPLYVFFLVVVIAAESIFAVVGGRPAEQWQVQPWTLLAQFTMTQGLFGPFGAYNPSWSLTHEIICYGIWGSLVVAVGRRLSGLVVLTLALLPLAAAVVFHAVVHDQTSWRILTLPLYFFIWLLGAAAAESRDLWRDRRGLTRIRFCALPLAAIFTAYLRFPGIPDTIGMVAFAALLAVALLHLPALPKPGPRLETLSRRLGLASYPIYLGHGIVLIAAVMAPAPSDVVVRAVMGIVLASLLSLSLGVVLEERTLAWRSTWLKRRFTRP